MARVVVLDDEANMGKVLGKLLTLEGFEVESFQEPVDALASLERNPADVLLTDLRMPEMTGEQVLEAVRERGLGCEVIVMTAYGTVDSAMRCVRNGAYDYVTKPFDTKSLLATVRGAAARHGSAPPIPPPPAESTERELLGDSPQMHAVRELIRKVAPSDSAVLITGESGTGKELAARAIHRLSRRANERFVAINCASIPESLMESELFGHEKGSFTGAFDTKIGLIESAHGGTLFLDEIGELPTALQAKLLRALQEREVQRIGAVDNIAVDIRVIAATNRRLEESVQTGQFRQDLYYRLNVLKIKLPALRDRPEDIPVLISHFLEIFSRRAARPGISFSPALLRRLQEVTWPGNVRELRNIVERIVVLAEENPVTDKILQELAAFDSQAIPPVRTDVPVSPAIAEDGEVTAFRDARDEFEASYLRAVLRVCGGNITEAARKAGISRRSFYEKIEKLGVDQSEFKPSS